MILAIESNNENVDLIIMCLVMIIMLLLLLLVCHHQYYNKYSMLLLLLNLMYLIDILFIHVQNVSKCRILLFSGYLDFHRTRFSLNSCIYHSIHHLQIIILESNGNKLTITSGRPIIIIIIISIISD